MSAEQKPTLFQELRRRNVLRVAVAYILAAWVILQVADVLFPMLQLPDWSSRLVAGLLILGFPLAVFFAWAFELTPDGIRRDGDVVRSEPRTTSRRLDIATIAVAVVAVGLFLADRFVASTLPLPERPSAPNSSLATERKSIVVLPFVNVSSDEEQEYFSDGLTEEVLNVLAQGREMRVIGRTSSFQFKGRNTDLRDIGRQLSVSHILEGSVRKSGDTVRISAQLADSADGSQLWSQTYERKLSDVFAVQNEIAIAVAEALQVELLGTGPAIHTRRNAEAYDLYLRGLRVKQNLNPDSIREAVDHFKRSVELDPEAAEAWQQLASSYTYMAVAGLVSTDEGIRLSNEAIDRALELDPTSSNNYFVLGNIRMNLQQDWTSAEDAFNRALELGPNNANAISGAGYLAMALGNLSDAMEFNARSISIDPLNLRSLHNRAFYLYLGREYEAAETAILDAIEFSGGNYIFANTVLSLTLLAQGRYDEALEASENELGEPWRLAVQSAIYHALERFDESEATLQRLIDGYSDRLAVPIGGTYAHRGDLDNAMKWLNRAYAQNDPQLMMARVHPMHDNLQGDPRFTEMLQKLGLLL